MFLCLHRPYLHTTCANVLASDQNASSGQTSGELKPDGQMAFFLIQQQADIQSGLNDMDMALADESGQLSATGLEGTNAGKVLQNLITSSHHIAEAVTISPEGKIVTASPRFSAARMRGYQQARSRGSLFKDQEPASQYGFSPGRGLRRIHYTLSCILSPEELS